MTMLDWLREITARLASFAGARARDRDLDAELAAHLDLATQDHIRRGLDPAAARRQARIDIGGLDQARELHRENRSLPTLEAIGQDLGLAIRTLRRDAGLAVFATLIVGLGVGASATVFSVINALMLRPLPFPDPAALVWIANDGRDGMSGRTIQVGHLQDFRAQSQAFEDVAGYFAFYATGDRKLIGQGEPERLTAVPVSENFFRLLGVTPALGRLFSAAECQPNGPPVALLSHNLWARRFASDPGIAGRAITLGNQSVIISGVLPASFDFASVFTPGGRADLFVPFPLFGGTNRMGNTMALVGRLKPGAAISRARNEARILAGRFNSEHPDRNPLHPTLLPLHEHVSGQFGPAMFLLACAVAAVMLIVCANLSNLLLARSAARQKEMAIRAALGAGPGRLIRQLLAESLVLSSGGALLGVLVAFAATRALAQSTAIALPLLDQVRVDTAALGFALILAVLTGLAFGLAPALRASGAPLHSSLKEGSRGSSTGGAQPWIRRALVVSEIALACILLAGAGLLIRSLDRTLKVDLGFQPHNAVAIRVDPRSASPEQGLRNIYIDEALRRARSAPGIQAVGLSDTLPLVGNRTWGIRARGIAFPPGQHPLAFVRIVSDGYFGAMGVTLRAGRDFTARDTPTSEPVIILNESLARKLWPGEDPIGKIVQTDRPERRVVGIAQDVRHLALEQASGFEMYLPLRQTNDYPAIDLVARGPHPPEQLAAALRTALQPLDPTLPASELRTIQALVDKSISPRRFIVLLLAAFSSFALILAALGVYGVISYSVNQRRREIGIRLALGESALGVQKRVLFQTLQLAGIGVALGITASLFLGRLIEGLLFEVTPSDPLTFAATPAVLALVAAAAGYLPARRASRIDPLKLLRAE